MSMRDMVSDITPVLLTMAAGVSDVVDRQGYNALTFICAVATAGGTLHVNEGDLADGSDMAPADGKDILGSAATVSIDGATAGDGRMIGYIGAKRYAQLSLTGAGSIASVFAVLGEPANGPTPNPPPTVAQLLAAALEALAAKQEAAPSPPADEPQPVSA